MKAFWILATIASLTGVTAGCRTQNSKDASTAQVQSQKLAIAVDVAVALLNEVENPHFLRRQMTAAY